MILIGLSGGIGSGKSTVARLLEAKGAVIVDADRIAHEVLAPGGPGEARVVERFGPEILGPDGAIDRARLRSIVFADDAARRDLEAIVHPLVFEEMSRRLAGHPEGTLVVVDAPLLVETQARDRLGLQALVVVAAEQADQIERVIARGGMNAAQASAVIAAQAPAERKLAAADYVVDNRGTLADLEESVETLWADLISRFS